MLGYPVVLARTAAQGTSLLRSHRPWLIVLDMSTPGPEAEQFRLDQLADPCQCDVPVVVVSPRYVGPIVADRLQAAGHLESPVELSDVAALVRHLAESHVH
jgi:CheY-like chemotaxis protein